MENVVRIKDLQNGDLFRMAHRVGTVYDAIFKYIKPVHGGKKARIMIQYARFEPYPLVDSDIVVYPV